MEPRSAERGNNSLNPCECMPQTGFNGATLSRTWKPDLQGDAWFLSTPLQWSHAQPNVETPRWIPRSPATTRRFNGATLSRTWKPKARLRAAITAARLQWSHAQPNVETIAKAAKAYKPKRASMEPRSAERGNSWVSSFNEAIHFASMEPRSAERGNPRRPTC